MDTGPFKAARDALVTAIADFTYSFFEGGGGGRGGADILNATAACDCIGRPGCACDKHASPPAANYYKPSLNSASVSFQKKLLDTSKSFQKSFGTGKFPLLCVCVR